MAETDFAPAPAITRALRRAVELGDTGYTPPDPGHRRCVRRLRTATLRMDRRPRAHPHDLRRHDGRRRDPPPRDRARATASSSPRRSTRRSTSASPRRAPSSNACRSPRPRPDGSSTCLGIEAALAGGARAVLLCNPHNPTGTAHSRAEPGRAGRPGRGIRRDGASATRSTRRSCTRRAHSRRSWMPRPPRRGSATPSPARARPSTSPD